MIKKRVLKFIAMIISCIFMTTSLSAAPSALSDTPSVQVSTTNPRLEFLAPLAESLLPQDVKSERHFAAWIGFISKTLTGKEKVLRRTHDESDFEILKNEILIYLRKEVAYLNGYTQSERFRSQFPDFKYMFAVDEVKRQITVTSLDDKEADVVDVVNQAQTMQRTLHVDTQEKNRVIEEASEMALDAFMADLDHVDGDIRIRGVVGIVQLIIDRRLPHKNEEIMNALRRVIVSDPSQEVRKVAERLYPDVAYGNDISLVHRVHIADRRDMITALVTGGAGFIGSHLCEFLLTQGYRVICVDNFISGTAANIAHLAKNENFFHLKHDMIQQLEVDLPIDYVFHLASLASPIIYRARPFETTKVAVYGTMNALKLAKEHSARFLFTSTSEVYGDPEVHPQTEDYRGNVNSLGERSCYDEGKRVAEALIYNFAKTFGLDARIARVFNTFGPRMKTDDGRAVPQFIKQALAGAAITVFGNGMQTRSLCYVDDMIQGLYTLITSDAMKIDFDPQERIINLGNPSQEITIKYLAEVIVKLANSKSSLTFENLPSDDPMKRQPSIERAERILKWSPQTPMNVGLQLTIDWVREHASRAPERMVFENDSRMTSTYTLQEVEDQNGPLTTLANAGSLRRTYDQDWETKEKRLFHLLDILGTEDTLRRILALEELVTLFQSKLISHRNENIITAIRTCIINDPDRNVRKAAQKAYQQIGYHYNIRPLRSVPIDTKTALQTVLVIGGAGFIGSHYCDQLLARRYRVICVDNFITGKKDNIIHLQTNPNFILVDHDINHPLQIKTPIDYVVHFASLASPKYYRALSFEEVKVNVFGTFNALKIAFEHNAAFLFSSTSEVYGNSLAREDETYWGNVALNGSRACYELGNRVAEAIISDSWREFNLDARIARVFNTFGPRMRPGDGRAIPTFIRQALLGENLTVDAGGLHTRSVCYVTDMVDGLIALMRKPLDDDLRPEKRVLNLGDPEKEFTILGLANEIIGLVKTASHIVTTAIPEGEPEKRKPSVERAKKYIGWTPKVSLADGLEATVTFEENILAMRNARPGVADLDLPTYVAQPPAEITHDPKKIVTQEELDVLLAPFDAETPTLDRDSLDRHEVAEPEMQTFLTEVYEQLAIDKPTVIFYHIPDDEAVDILLLEHQDGRMTVTYREDIKKDEDLFKTLLLRELLNVLIAKRFSGVDDYTKNIFSTWVAFLFLEEQLDKSMQEYGEGVTQARYKQIEAYLSSTHNLLGAPLHRVFQLFMQYEKNQKKKVTLLRRLLETVPNQELDSKAFAALKAFAFDFIGDCVAALVQSFENGFDAQEETLVHSFMAKESKRAIVLYEPDEISVEVLSFLERNQHVKLFVYTHDKTQFSEIEDLVTVVRGSDSFTFSQAIDGGLAFTDNERDHVSIILRTERDLPLIRDKELLIFAANSHELGTHLKQYVDLLIPISATFTEESISAIAGKDKLLDSLGRIFIINENYIAQGISFEMFAYDLPEAAQQIATEIYRAISAADTEHLIKISA